MKFARRFIQLNMFITLLALPMAFGQDSSASKQSKPSKDGGIESVQVGAGVGIMTMGEKTGKSAIGGMTENVEVTYAFPESLDFWDRTPVLSRTRLTLKADALTQPVTSFDSEDSKQPAVEQTDSSGNPSFAHYVPKSKFEFRLDAPQKFEFVADGAPYQLTPFAKVFAGSDLSLDREYIAGIGGGLEYERFSQRRRTYETLRGTAELETGVYMPVQNTSVPVQGEPSAFSPDAIPFGIARLSGEIKLCGRIFKANSGTFACFEPGASAFGGLTLAGITGQVGIGMEKFLSDISDTDSKQNATRLMIKTKTEGTLQHDLEGTSAAAQVNISVGIATK